MAVKAAVAAAADESNRKRIAVVVCSALLIVLLPLIAIMSLLSGGADHNIEYAVIAFNEDPIPDGTDPEYAGYIVKMREAFTRLDNYINEINEKITNLEDSLDAIRIKAVFYALFFGTDFSGLAEDVFSAFVSCFVNADGGSNPAAAKDMEEVYTALTPLVGREITETDKQNSNSTYMLVKYGYTAGAGASGIPGEAFSDADFAKLMSVATKFVGYPYVWGGSSPSTSFDCSGLICYSYTKSGVYNLPRTTAQGIYNQCTPVAASEAKPGDLVFFTKTYKGSPPVSHIGIYVGGGQMLQAGEPRISYADLNNSYWAKHLLGYGRLKAK